ncbi:hypothetical protein GW17_00009270 [Ensete ventricosum]|nr:hypothetical protein GW17_00009270 [Ensete ventricosum]
MRDPSGQIWEHAMCLKFSTTDNEAEYEALLFKLRLATELQAEHLEVFIDSQLVTGQVDRSFEAREPNMARANALARSASADTVDVEPSTIPSIRQPTVATIEEATIVAHPDLREEILHYKRDATLLMNKAVAR